ncbi:MAG: cobalamin biosynthesis protein CobW [Hyphomicrobiaceae bacterium]|nr:cobalamin biosynthesis protein CobW [Hyphomicrobiaceae bacterium]
MTEHTGKIPATVITGFLGAGKTTIIRRLLETANGRRIALIINEFGDVGVDGDVLKGCGDEACSEDDVIELANGCICCTVADDFVPTMTQLLDRSERPDHIVIETSGLALPQPLVKAFNWPEIRNRVTVDGVITVVDSAAVSEGRFAADEQAVQAQREADEALDHESPLHELFEDQLACADLILLNKADLVDAATLDEIESDLKREVRSSVSFVGVRNGEVGADIVLGLDASAQDDLENRKSHHEQAGHDDHDHDDFESFVVSPGTARGRDDVVATVTRVIGEHGILRLKGFVDIADADARLVIQAVGPRVDAYFDRPWQTGETRGSSLVVIGEKGLDEAAIRAALEG